MGNRYHKDKKLNQITIIQNINIKKDQQYCYDNLNKILIKAIIFDPKYIFN